MVDIDELLSQIDLVQLFKDEGYEPVKESQKIWKMVCPFHADRGPSLKIFAETKTWRCFGCDAGGTAVDLILQHHQCSTKDALLYLASKFSPGPATLQEVIMRLEKASNSLAPTKDEWVTDDLRARFHHDLLVAFRDKGLEYVEDKHRQLHEFLLQPKPVDELSRFLQEIHVRVG